MRHRACVLLQVRRPTHSLVIKEVNVLILKCFALLCCLLLLVESAGEGPFETEAACKDRANEVDDEAHDVEVEVVFYI